MRALKNMESYYKVARLSIEIDNKKTPNDLMRYSFNNESFFESMDSLKKHRREESSIGITRMQTDLEQSQASPDKTSMIDLSI